jgi:hypothetical protein
VIKILSGDYIPFFTDKDKKIPYSFHPHPDDHGPEGYSSRRRTSTTITKRTIDFDSYIPIDGLIFGCFEGKMKVFGRFLER